MEKILLDEKYEQLLFQIPLLRDLPHNIKQSLLEKLEYSVYSIDKKDIVARQGTPCKKLYILLEGKLRVDIIDGLGNKVMVEYIVDPRAFATSMTHFLCSIWTVRASLIIGSLPVNATSMTGPRICTIFPVSMDFRTPLYPMIRFISQPLHRWRFL